jgi:hypothetical protein
VVVGLERRERVAIRHPSRPPRHGVVLPVLRRDLRRPVRWFVHEGLPPIAVYAGIRLVGLVALVLVADHLGINGLARLDTYDARPG